MYLCSRMAHAVCFVPLEQMAVWAAAKWEISYKNVYAHPEHNIRPSLASKQPSNPAHETY